MTGTPHKNIIGLTKPRLRWVGHIARMGEERRIKGSGGKTWEKETTWKS